MRPNSTIRIGAPLLAESGGAWRVSADVAGHSVWFESPDVPLVPSAEAFASAFLVSSLAHRRRLVSEAPLDPTWLAHNPRLVEIFHRWWRYPRLVPTVADAPARAPQAGSGVAVTAAPAEVAARTAPDAPRGRGLFFSGGVDSFHALLCRDERIDRLVFVHGFDIALEEDRRMEATLAGIREVADEEGMGLVRVRTNLRAHPLIHDTSWERANGGALAAIAHALAGVLQEMLIGSSIAVQWTKAWGSHWETDPLFSSSRMRLVEIGQELRRMEKVRRIAAHPLVQKHLRVCWANRTASGNCSRCGKCVIARLMLAEVGMLSQFTGFDGPATLARDLDALRNDSHRNSLTDIVQLGNLEPDLQRAAVALLRRIEHAESFPVRTRRAMLRRVRSWIGADRT